MGERESEFGNFNYKISDQWALDFNLTPHNSRGLVRAGVTIILGSGIIFGAGSVIAHQQNVEMAPAPKDVTDLYLQYQMKPTPTLEINNITAADVAKAIYETRVNGKCSDAIPPGLEIKNPNGEGDCPTSTPKDQP